MPRGMAAQLLDEYLEPPREPGEVPVVATVAHESPRRRHARFLDESLHSQRAGRGAPRGVDVAQTGRGECRFQTDGDQAVAFRRGPHRGPHRPSHLGGAMHHMVGRQPDHQRAWDALHQRESRQPVRICRAAGRRLEDHVRSVDLRQDRLDDLALPRLGEHEHLVGHCPGAVICRSQQRPAAIGQRQHVLGRRTARARPQPRPRAAGRNDCNGRHDSSSASSLARAVDSHGASMSVRPKWPYAAVWRNSGRRRFSSLMMPSGLRSNSLETAAAMAVSGTLPVPNVSTRIATGFTTPMAYETWTSHLRASSAATMFFATLRAPYAPARSTFGRSLPEKQPPPWRAYPP